MEQGQEGRKVPFESQARGILANECSIENWLRSSPRTENSMDSPSSPPAMAIPSASSSFSACDFVLDINSYIPAGSLRIERHKSSISIEVWTSVSQWQGFAHPREFVASVNGAYLQNILQEKLFGTTTLQPFRNLHQAGWIRLEFMARDAEWGQTRVWILPEDVGNRQIERADNALRKSLQRLTTELDTAKATWDGQWLPSDPISYLDSPSEDEKKSDVSLLHLFNTLPSPSPDPSMVQDIYAKSAMEDILRGDIEGLTTKMFAYQRRSTAMMLQKEAQPALIVDPRLRKRTDQGGNTWYCDVNTGTCLRAPRIYEAARGGIMAENMGLGKTLICIALILSTRELSSKIPEQYSVGTLPIRPRVGSLLDMSAATIGRTGTPWKGYFSQLRRNGLECEQCVDALRKGIGFYYIPAPTPRRLSRRLIEFPPRKIYLTAATLVVVPANLVRQWESELKKHTNDLLKVLVLSKSSDELPQAPELAEYDIILFSRQRFEKESRDGTDSSGHRASLTPKGCSCRTGVDRSCRCSESDVLYHSPLRDLHFKRLITDEGHTMGNSSNRVASNAVIVVDFLNVSSRWIVSGTPTQGLYGESMLAADVENNSNVSLSSDSMLLGSSNDIDPERERKDLEKLGNIATHYLKARPWSNIREDRDLASWAQYVMQPRHSSRSRGNMECLRSTLEGMIIRHRTEDVDRDVELPPLHHNTVYLDGSFQDKLSLNLFSLVIISNAVTSERKDADYLFHYKQRKELDLLVANLREASFFWSGFQRNDIEFTINFAKAFLDKREVYTTNDDNYLLQRAVDIGSMALSNSIWCGASKYHEMPLYIENKFTTDVQAAWALDSIDQNPTLLGATQLLSLQGAVGKMLAKHWGLSGLKNAGKEAMEMALISSLARQRPNQAKTPQKLDKILRNLAGVPKVDEDLSPRKRQKKAVEANVSKQDPKLIPQGSFDGMASTSGEKSQPLPAGIPIGILQVKAQQDGQGRIASLPGYPFAGNLTSDRLISLREDLKDSEVPLVSATMLSTASSKLSYLVSQVVKYQRDEKIIIFYETDNVAYYIAQALEAINIEHLIYAKTLSADRRARYLVSFNLSPRFRCLLMDLSQAAFGLDVSSASRVFFVNPVLSRQIEVQAVKRAHRIGQCRPVYVETLVLKGSVEEVILERRNAMSNGEQTKCKTILDDKTMYNWVKNAQLVAMPKGDIPGSEQMAKLEIPQPVFGSTKDIGLDTDGVLSDPDEGLVSGFSPRTPSKKKGKRKTPKLTELNNDADEADEEIEVTQNNEISILFGYSTPDTRPLHSICPLLSCLGPYCHHYSDEQVGEMSEMEVAILRQIAAERHRNSEGIDEGEEDAEIERLRLRMPRSGGLWGPARGSRLDF